MTSRPTTSALTQRLSHKDENVRLRAAMDLGTSDDPEAAAVLVARLGTEVDPAVKEMITWATVQHADQAMDALMVQLYSAESAVRAQAAHVLSKIGGDVVVRPIIPVLADEDPVVAVKACRAAASTGSPEVVPALIARLGHGDAAVRDALTDALLVLSAWSTGPLIAAVDDRDPIVRIHAADALSDLGSPGADDAIPVLARHLIDPEPDVRLAMACALSRLDPVRTTGLLRELAEGADPELAYVAGRLLQR
ncbi:HEAT repeat domain-containing protein [Raineyella fluvialis]|uniref:HEAT repeat domain-containing protein n=1 Tax=Raineyella fluvialis TaxID=2662261 RepID=A0A5Q2FEG8_9ACTN|nr:HEAT repeat domain-containing protein [Raineyella fluvialis]QGF23115.1 HEAT repeat domain-containing protein [Raineyella fluvialis]